jgi:hypothetical protein
MPEPSRDIYANALGETVDRPFSSADTVLTTSCQRLNSGRKSGATPASCCCSPSWSPTGPAPVPRSSPTSRCPSSARCPAPADAWIRAFLGEDGYLAGNDAEAQAQAGAPGPAGPHERTRSRGLSPEEWRALRHGPPRRRPRLRLGRRRRHPPPGRPREVSCIREYASSADLSS